MTCAQLLEYRQTNVGYYEWGKRHTNCEDAGFRARRAGRTTPHEFSTFDFVAMYPSIPVVPLKPKMKQALELAFENRPHCLDSGLCIYIQWGYASNETTPTMRDIHSTTEEPRDQNRDNCMEFYVGPDRVSARVDLISRWEGMCSLGRQCTTNHQGF